MDSFLVTLLVILIAVLIFLLYLLMLSEKPKGRKTKSVGAKREEIIQKYRDFMQKEAKKYENSPQEWQKRRVKLLKAISHELSRNIYIENSEIKSIIDELIKNDLK